MSTASKSQTKKMRRVDRWRVVQIGGHHWSSPLNTLWRYWTKLPRFNEQWSPLPKYRNTEAIRRELKSLDVEVWFDGVAINRLIPNWSRPLLEVPGMRMEFAANGFKKKRGVTYQTAAISVAGDDTVASPRRSFIRFPWGSISANAWEGWPRVGRDVTADFVLVKFVPDWASYRHKGRIIYLPRTQVAADPECSVSLPGDSVDVAARKLYLFGFWAAERCFEFPDELPFAKAAWAVPSAYGIWADYLLEQGFDVTAAAFQRAAYLGELVGATPTLQSKAGAR